ncbi:APC family permease [Alkalinema sp. FACHB-956]|uniref:APC family permease n=1 Tax=Alkalinema sp. FACHB-956 TaxID=2692768 RepID=UPI001682705B|nr:APC family permease [Alkalinema sp. FACHB-956]MBD2329023.1 APC family permease [Alkalinema sp. FACHB-956]
MTFSQLKRLLVGESLPTSAHAEERLTKAAALAVLSSDALSSVAYATQETLLVLMAAGSSRHVLGWSLPIALAIVILLIIVMVSYRQTIRAYPKGGGSYIVARENLGLYPGLIAGASLMIDYILTVAVSVSAGIDNLVSALPALRPLTVDLCLIFIFLLMIANLRGVKESGRIFMVPTYAFIGSIFLLLGIGFFNQLTGNITPVPPPAESIHHIGEELSLFLVLRAFAAGCTALTGVEAISDGVLAFKPPEWKNARQTLLALGIILGIMFLGITYLANLYQVVPADKGETVLSILSRQIVGTNFLYYFIVLFATPTILLLAANTSYADFPRLCYFLARDGFLPRQLSLLGDRLVYSNGILLLSLSAALLVIMFKGDTTAIIPLYAVGVFTSFTLSQAGMVRHWFKEQSKGWQVSAWINGIGTLATLLVLAIVIWTKFALGAWVVVFAIPCLVIFFGSIHRHYRYVADKLSLATLTPKQYVAKPATTAVSHPAIVIVGQVHRGTIEALDYARGIADKIVAVHVDIGGDNEKFQRDWQTFAPDIPLKVLPSPYRSVVEPIVDYVRDFEARYPGVLTTIIIPAFVTRRWWEELLHNQTTLFLKNALRTKKSRVITTVRYYL